MYVILSFSFNVQKYFIYSFYLLVEIFADTAEGYINILTDGGNGMTGGNGEDGDGGPDDDHQV